MKKKILKTISLFMALTISVCTFASCMDFDELEQMVDESIARDAVPFTTTSLPLVCIRKELRTVLI